jgi:hypothetical protein
VLLGQSSSSERDLDRIGIDRRRIGGQVAIQP